MNRSFAPTLSVLLFVLAAAPLPAQTGRIEGTVTDSSTGVPVANAEILVVGSNYAGHSEANGRYVIADVAAGTYALDVRRIGYRTSDVRAAHSQRLRPRGQLARRASGLEQRVHQLGERTARVADAVSVVHEGPPHPTPTATPADTLNNAKYFGFTNTNRFDRTRGTYHQSSYHYRRFGLGGSWQTGPQLAMSVTEMNLLKAEALIRLNRAAEAVPLINVSSLWDALRYEKRLEMAGVDPTVAYYDARGWQSLVVNTFVQWPVPGRELIMIGAPTFTFGGGGGRQRSGAGPRAVSGRAAALPMTGRPQAVTVRAFARSASLVRPCSEVVGNGR